MSTLDVASVLIAMMVNWVTRVTDVLFVTFTTFNEVYIALLVLHVVFCCSVIVSPVVLPSAVPVNFPYHFQNYEDA